MIGDTSLREALCFELKLIKHKGGASLSDDPYALSSSL